MGEAGDAASFRFGVQRIRVGDGELLDIGGPGTVTVVVGANNVGKSTFLQQIKEILASPDLRRDQWPRVVTEISSPWGGTAADMAEWLRATSKVTRMTETIETAFRPGIQSFPIHGLLAQRQRPTPASLVNWFVSHQTAGQRLTGADDAPRMQAPGEPPANALQVLHVDREKLDELSDILKRLFDFDLFLERTGIQMSLRVGKPASPPYDVESFNEGYDLEVASLPYVKHQGDGIKSAVGLLLPLITDPYRLHLVDEPEAFLHPPQARIVGQEIGNQAKNNGLQIIVATHDRSILQGVMESGAPTFVVHLNRKGTTAIAATLDPSEVAALWDDPALRYTSALEGLFHQAVIVAENERDAHFYNAAIDCVLSARSPKSAAHNLMFLGSNGKSNMARIVAGLKRLGIRVVSCPDLDVLNDDGLFRRLVEAHGGSWGDIADDYKRATNLLRDTPDAPFASDVEQAITEVFKNSTETKLTRSMANDIRSAATVPRSNWHLLKQFGRDALRADIGATNRLLDKMDDLGIVAVQVGELENFVTTRNIAKGPEFLNTAFAEDVHKGPRAVDQAERILRASKIC